MPLENSVHLWAEFVVQSPFQISRKGPKEGLSHDCLPILAKWPGGMLGSSKGRLKGRLMDSMPHIAPRTFEGSGKGAQQLS